MDNNRIIWGEIVKKVFNDLADMMNVQHPKTNDDVQNILSAAEKREDTRNLTNILQCEKVVKELIPVMGIQNQNPTKKEEIPKYLIDTEKETARITEAEKKFYSRDNTIYLYDFLKYLNNPARVYLHKIMEGKSSSLDEQAYLDAARLRLNDNVSKALARLDFRLNNFNKISIMEYFCNDREAGAIPSMMFNQRVTPELGAQDRMTPAMAKHLKELFNNPDFLKEETQDILGGNVPKVM